MNNVLIKTNRNIHEGIDSIKDKYFKSVLTYFIVAEAKETENFYTIDDLIINHMVRNNYRFDINLIDDSCNFVDAYLIELTLYLPDNKTRKTVCYINKEIYKDLQNDYLTINQ